MRVSDLHREEEGHDDFNEGGLSAAEFREQHDSLRERQELISALRNFAEHFGATEVYQQARAIYLESPEGLAEREREATASFDAVLQNANRSLSERQKQPSSGRKISKGSPAFADAKKALGG